MCTCTGSQDSCLGHVTPTSTNAHTPAHERLCNSAATSCGSGCSRFILRLVDGRICAFAEVSACVALPSRWARRGRAQYRHRMRNFLRFLNKATWINGVTHFWINVVWQTTTFNDTRSHTRWSTQSIHPFISSSGYFFPTRFSTPTFFRPPFSTHLFSPTSGWKLRGYFCLCTNGQSMQQPHPSRKWTEMQQLSLSHSLCLACGLFSFLSPAFSLFLSSFSLFRFLWLILSLTGTLITAPVNKENIPTAVRHGTSCSAQQYK